MAKPSELNLAFLAVVAATDALAGWAALRNYSPLLSCFVIFSVVITGGRGRWGAAGAGSNVRRGSAAGWERPPEHAPSLCSASRALTPLRLRLPCPPPLPPPARAAAFAVMSMPLLFLFLRIALVISAFQLRFSLSRLRNLLPPTTAAEWVWSAGQVRGVACGLGVEGGACKWTLSECVCSSISLC